MAPKSFCYVFFKPGNQKNSVKPVLTEMAADYQLGLNFATSLSHLLFCGFLAAIADVYNAGETAVLFLVNRWIIIFGALLSFFLARKRVTEIIDTIISILIFN